MNLPEHNSVKAMLVDRKEKLIYSITSYSNCARIYDDTSREHIKWKREYEAKCKRVFSEIKELERQIREATK